MTTFTVDGCNVVVKIVVLDCDGVFVSVAAVLVVVIGLVGAELEELSTVVVGAGIDGVVADGFGTNESTTPIGPSKSTSDSGHESSSGWME